MPKKLIAALLLLALGFIFIVLDIPISSGIDYPHQYENSNKVTGEFQYYNIKSNYDARCTYKLIDPNKSLRSKSIEKPSEPSSDIKPERKPAKPIKVQVIDKVFFKKITIDIFSDFLGFIFIIIGSAMLTRCSTRFKFTILCAVSGLIIKTLLFALPFVINGLALTNASFFIGMIYLACNLVTIFLATSGLFHMIPGPWCRDERKWCKILWFTSFVLQIVATFTFWLGSDFGMLLTLSKTTYIILVIVMILFWLVLLRARDYIRGSYEKYYCKES